MGNITWNFEGKVVVITGSATGIGRGTALEFAKAGANVMLFDFNYDEVCKTAEKCRAVAKGGKINAYKVDVTNVEQIRAARDAVLEEFGRVDILFSNAGLGGKNMGPPLEKVPYEDWELDFSVNTLGMVKVCTEFAQIFRNQNAGKVVLTSSVAAYTLSTRTTPYTASKIACVAFGKTYAIEMGEFNTNVNILMPGFVYTNIYSDGTGMRYREAIGGGLLQFDNDEDVMNAMARSGSSMQRAQTVEDMAYMVMFLCSDEAKEITGQAIAVDSGYLKRV